MKHFFQFKTGYLILLMVAFSGLLSGAKAQNPPVTGLSDWTIFIDPGHSQKENMGLYNYSEAEKVLRVSLFLRDMLEQQTDIKEVYMARTNDTQLVGLTQRTNLANSLSADFFYSVHSDAGAPSTNSTLMLWGGWRSNGQNVEKTPQGGKSMGEIMDRDLTASMRIARRGGYYDRTFYQGFPENHANKWPYLHVNRESNMPSLLSEAGFHTNPTQQMRNLNAEWKKLEAQSAFWSILEYHGIDRPQVGILAGYITDDESGELINGATIEFAGRTYTTDTYESLFNQHSNNPDLLRNGFFYIDEIEPGTSDWMVVSAPGYYRDSVFVELRTDFFTFSDFSISSTIPPTVISTNPVSNSTTYDPMEPIVIDFSRRVLESSLEGQISFVPEIDFTYSLVNNQRQLRIQPIDMPFVSEYTLTLGDDIEDLAGHKFDGNSDGSEGGTFSLSFRSRAADITPPAITDVFPDEGTFNINRRAIVTFMMDEQVDPETITSQSIRLVNTESGQDEAVTIRHYLVNGRTVIQAFPNLELAPNTEYLAYLMPGIADIHGNVRQTQSVTSFETEGNSYTYRSIDNFNSGINGWWATTASGSNLGFIPEETERIVETGIVNPQTGSTSAMRIKYGWDTSAGQHLTRTYLPPAAAQNTVRFDRNNILEAYVFGDGSGNRFRFMLRDGNEQLEGSPWITVNWIGWKLVRWNMATTPAVGWVNGNGTVDGNAYTDSFQLTYSMGSPAIGSFVFDDYRVATVNNSVSIDDPSTTVPTELALKGNYPNPFNPVTTIRYQVPENTQVSLQVYDMLGRLVTTLVDTQMPAGTHEAQFDASSLSSGVYLYRLSASGKTLTGKMMLVK